MGDKLKGIFTEDEWAVLVEVEKEIPERLQDLPQELNVDQERMGGFIDE